MNKTIKQTPTMRERWLDAETRCGKWLADGNLYREAGNLEQAEKCYAKSQFWLDRANALELLLFLERHK